MKVCRRPIVRGAFHRVIVLRADGSFKSLGQVCGFRSGKKALEGECGTPPLFSTYRDPKATGFAPPHIHTLMAIVAPDPKQ